MKTKTIEASLAIVLGRVYGESTIIGTCHGTTISCVIATFIF